MQKHVNKFVVQHGNHVNNRNYLCVAVCELICVRLFCERCAVCISHHNNCFESQQF